MTKIFIIIILLLLTFIVNVKESFASLEEQTKMDNWMIKKGYPQGPSNELYPNGPRNNNIQTVGGSASDYVASFRGPSVWNGWKY